MKRSLRQASQMLPFQEAKDQVQQCLDKASITDLGQVFTQLSENTKEQEDFYKNECQKNNIHQWPSQTTFREAYLGEVFYPQKAIALSYEHESNTYLRERFDVLWALAASARFHNPLGLYYLTLGMEKHIDKISDCDPDFVPKLYKRALGDLETVEGNDAIYLLRARDYECSRWGSYEFDDEKAFALYAQCHDLEAKLQILKIRSRYIGYEKPTLEEYLALAQRYPKAYVDAAKLLSSFEEKVRLLTLASEKEYDPALLELGFLYKMANQPEKALTYYAAYGDKDYPEGYIYSSELYVGGVDWNKRYKKSSHEELNQAVFYLEKAHVLHHPSASYRLGILYLELLTRNKDHLFEEKATTAIHKACILGEMRAYDYLNDSHNTIDQLFKEIRKMLSFVGYRE